MIAATVAHMNGGKPLFLLQVNCRSSYNKTLVSWNLRHIALMVQQVRNHGGMKKLAMRKFLGLITKLSEETGTLTVSECLFV